MAKKVKEGKGGKVSGKGGKGGKVSDLPTTEPDPKAGKTEEQAKTEQLQTTTETESTMVSEQDPKTEQPEQPETTETEPTEPVSESNMVSEQDPKTEEQSAEQPTETEPLSESKTEQVENAMPPIIAFSYATTIKEDLVNGASVTMEQAQEVMQTLARNRSAFLNGKQKEGDLQQYDSMVEVVKNKIESKLGPIRDLPAVTEGQVEEVANAATVAADVPVAPKPATKTPQELVEAGLKKIVDFLTKFKSERVCHASHVHDFCKQNSTDGFEYEFKDNAVINASYFGGKNKASLPFSL